MTDQQIAPGQGPTPVGITVQGSEQLMPKLAFASYDGTGAAGDFLPCIRFVGPGGQVAGQAVGDVVTAGASVDQTWFRGLAQKGSGAALTATTEYAKDGGSIVVPGTGVGGNDLAWAHGSGAFLLDYSTPTAPTIIADGIYVVTVYAYMATLVFTHASVMSLGIVAGSAGGIVGICPLATAVSGGGGAGVEPPTVCLTMPPVNLIAGDTLVAEVRQGSGVNLTFALQNPKGAIITKLG